MATQDADKYHHEVGQDYDKHHHDVEKNEVLNSPSSNSTFETEFTPEEQRKIIHRVDRRLVVTVGILYCISLMDRTNLSSAAIAGCVGKF